MLRLIKTEFKKIFKMKMNIIIITVAIIGAIGFATLKYIEYDTSQSYDGGLANLSGEKISGIEVCQSEDQLMHQYAGEYNQEKYNQLNKEYKSLIKKYSYGKLDDDAMKNYYGNQYMELVNHFYEGTLTMKIVEDYCKKYDVDIIDNQTVMSLKDEKPSMTLYTENMGIINFIKKAFFGFSVQNTDDMSLFENAEKYKSLLEVVEHQKIKKLNENELMALTFSGVDDKELQIYYNYLNTQVRNLPTYFDSALPNEMLDLTLSSTIWIGMLSIMIVLANTFGMEKQFNMQQLIYPTKSGKLKITIAKLITTILFSIIMMSLIILSCFFVSLVILPIHSIDMTILSERISLSAFTWRYYFMYMILLVVFAGMATGLLTALLSYITKNRFTTIIVTMLFTISGFPISQSGKFPDIILSILPYNMAIYGGYFSSPQFQFPYTFINGQIVILRDVALIVWAVLFVVICGGLILHSKKSYIRS